MLGIRYIGAFDAVCSALEVELAHGGLSPAGLRSLQELEAATRRHSQAARDEAVSAQRLGEFPAYKANRPPTPSLISSVLQVRRTHSHCLLLLLCHFSIQMRYARVYVRRRPPSSDPWAGPPSSWTASKRTMRSARYSAFAAARRAPRAYPR